MISALFILYKPYICPGCKEPSPQIICKHCFLSMRKNHALLSPSNGGLKGIFPIFISFSSTHQILTYWKDFGGEELRSLLFNISPALRELLREMTFDLIVPIPQKEERSLKRGHASAFEVAKYFSQELNVSLDSVLALRNILTSKQADLNEWERRYSENPFELGKPFSTLKYKRILLVDDFITTGATLEKAANVILEIYPDVEIYAASLGWKPKPIKKRDPEKDHAL